MDASSALRNLPKMEGFSVSGSRGTIYPLKQDSLPHEWGTSRNLEVRGNADLSHLLIICCLGKIISLVVSDTKKESEC